GRILPPGMTRNSWQSRYFLDVYYALCTEHGISLENPGPDTFLRREVAWQIAALHLQARVQFRGVSDGRNANAFNKTLSTALKMRERLARLAKGAVPPVAQEPPSTPPPLRRNPTATPAGAAHARTAQARKREEAERCARHGPPPIHP